jgi:hypothetical protein
MKSYGIFVAIGLLLILNSEKSVNIKLDIRVFCGIGSYPSSKLSVDLKSMFAFDYFLIII